MPTKIIIIPTKQQRKTYPVIEIDQSGEAVDLTYTAADTLSEKEPVISLRAGVPAMGTPEFDQYLKDRHAKHNQ